jgi:hypothetical protein
MNILVIHKNITLYFFVFNNGGWKNFNIELIDNFFCNNKRDAHYIEQFYINEFDSNLNSQNSYRTFEQFKNYNLSNYKVNYNKNKYIKDNCKLCNNLVKRKVKNRPSYDILINDFKNLKTYRFVGQKYNVSDNTIRKWMKSNLDVAGSNPTGGYLK